jgi:hypothetical protein
MMEIIDVLNWRQARILLAPELKIKKAQEKNLTS